jgi:hypothetical protein
MVIIDGKQDGVHPIAGADDNQLLAGTGSRRAAS